MKLQDVARDGKELRAYSSPQQDDNDKVPLLEVVNMQRVQPCLQLFAQVE